jgi:hypothetical protein
MKANYAQLLISLRYRENVDQFDVSLAYDSSDDPEDRLVFADPLELDLDELEDLVHDSVEYGAALSRMFFADPKTSALFTKAIADSDRKPLNLRLLIDPRAPLRYHAVRWETLREPFAGSGRIATKHNVRLSRYLDSHDWRTISLPPKHDLSALVVVANPSDIQTKVRVGTREQLPPIHAKDELRRARDAFRGMRVVELTEPGTATLERIIAELPGCDIFYLVCHGGLDDETPRLYLEDANGETAVIDGTRLAERINDLSARPMVAVLCSCQSAGQGDIALARDAQSSDDGALAALGPRLSAAGVAAVVAMQGNITMATAELFFPAFFGELAKDGLVEHAMSVARGRISHRERDWWVPILFSRLKAGRTWYMPGFSGKGNAPLNSIVTKIKIASCTPVIGSGVAGEGLLPSREELASDWSERFLMPIAAQSRSDLAKVAQYLEVSTAVDQPRSELVRYLISDFRDQHSSELPAEMRESEDADALIRTISRTYYAEQVNPYDVLASLNLPVYVTTSWTGLLEDALAAADRPPIKEGPVSFEWRKTRHRSSPAPEPTRENPLVYHLFGTISDPDSLVLSEDDYFSWLEAWISLKEMPVIVPPSVTEALSQKSLMFLGYRLDDWEFRVLFRSIKSLPGSSEMNKKQHIGVQVSPDSAIMDPDAAQDYLESYFSRNHHVDIYWGRSQSFLADLAAKL